MMEEIVVLNKKKLLVPKLRFKEFGDKWNDKKLGDVLEITSASRVHKDEWTENGVPFFRSSDIVAAFKGTENTKAYISFELYTLLANKSGRVKKDDLLITGGGSIGIPFLIKNNEPLYFKDADLLWVKNTHEISGYFLYSFFLTQSFKNYINITSHVGTIAHYTVIQAKNTPFQFPSLPEQQKIASFLSAVDEKIQQLTRKKELLEQYKKGVMQQLFSGKLRFRDDKGKEYPDWEEKNYEDIYSFYTTNSFSRDNLNYVSGVVKNIHYGDIHTKFKTLLNIEEEQIPFVNEDISLSKIKDDNYCKEGDLIIADASEDYKDIGKCVEVYKLNNEKLIAGLHTFLARPNKIKMYKGFGGYLVQAPYVRKQIMTIAQGTKVLSLSTGRLGKVKLLIPVIEEQKKMTEYLRNIDRKIEIINNQITQPQTLKKGLLQQMFV